eukprot:1928081-Rhodomonas_salina.3
MRAAAAAMNVSSPSGNGSAVSINETTACINRGEPAAEEERAERIEAATLDANCCPGSTIC